MIIFQTPRLYIRTFNPRDKKYFIELVTKLEIINPVPQAPMKADEIEEKFTSATNPKGTILENEKSIWAICEKGREEVIGLCALLTNDEGDRELGYRFRVEYWGKGYGTEVTKGLIDFCFQDLQLEKITADVDITNIASAKILNKFLKPVREFFNEKDNCTDQRYELYK
ncbi:MAG: ribosomal-protein-alanine N-acetyltransferase [Saprospiraceae bacterium]|jgi:ribosomal-protein-alanine N-acetyltransferase